MGRVLPFPSFCVGNGDPKHRFERKRERLRGGPIKAGVRDPHDRDLLKSRPVTRAEELPCEVAGEKKTQTVTGGYGDIYMVEATACLAI